ncbi:hypothetical protein PRO82_001942 [Candidatus Protochlamydia amoebophila]|nr:hypothetical protein [Candidatus Protochlamydia amoebophila]
MALTATKMATSSEVAITKAIIMDNTYERDNKQSPVLCLEEDQLIKDLNLP